MTARPRNNPPTDSDARHRSPGIEFLFERLVSVEIRKPSAGRPKPTVVCDTSPPWNPLRVLSNDGIALLSPSRAPKCFAEYWFDQCVDDRRVITC